MVIYMKCMEKIKEEFSSLEKFWIKHMSGVETEVEEVKNNCAHS